MIHAVIGTKAEYIKTAPVLRELDAREVPCRIVDVGQHAALPRSFRADLGLGDPDLRLDNRGNAENAMEAARWMLRTARHLLWSRRRLRREVFGDEPGVCLVHGDTPSTLLAALIGRRAGMPVAHLESGLRSGHLLHPFPEELTRVLVMRLASILYAPDEHSRLNLEAMKVKGEVVETGGNTSIDAIAYAARTGRSGTQGPGIVTVHRVENLYRKERLDGLLAVLRSAAERGPVRFLVHEPTEQALKRHGRWHAALEAGAVVEPLIPHDDFLLAVRGAPWVITDGGSIQEECAALGVPTLLWRARTERRDGVGENVVISAYDMATIDEFLTDTERYRRDPLESEWSPAVAVVDHLVSRDT